MALDPSKGSDAKSGDYSAFVMLGVDRHGIVYVEADLARRPTPQIVADGVELLRRFQPDAFAVETNQFQDLLATEFEAEIRRQGLLAARPIPIENHANKMVRIRRLGPFLSTRRCDSSRPTPPRNCWSNKSREFPRRRSRRRPRRPRNGARLAGQWLQGRAINDGLGNRLPVTV